MKETGSMIGVRTNLRSNRVSPVRTIKKECSLRPGFVFQEQAIKKTSTWDEVLSLSLMSLSIPAHPRPKPTPLRNLPPRMLKWRAHRGEHNTKSGAWRVVTINIFAASERYEGQTKHAHKRLKAKVQQRVVVVGELLLQATSGGVGVVE